MKNAYWSNFSGLSVSDYVAQYVERSAIDRHRMEATIQALPPGIATLLDVGCGFGHFARLACDQRGVTAFGVEITPEKVEYAKTALGVDASLASIDSLPFPDKAFDAVCALEVLEHLPQRVFADGRAEIARVAREWIVVSVPWRERRQNVTCPACGCAFNPNLHLRSFADEDFSTLFGGFELRRLEAMGERRELPAWWRALSRPSWPSFAVCPACGWQKAAMKAPGVATPDQPSGQGALTGLRARLRHWASSSQPCWYLALFRRKGAL